MLWELPRSPAVPPSACSVQGLAHTGVQELHSPEPALQELTHVNKNQTNKTKPTWAGFPLGTELGSLWSSPPPPQCPSGIPSSACLCARLCRLAAPGQ